MFVKVKSKNGFFYLSVESVELSSSERSQIFGCDCFLNVRFVDGFLGVLSDKEEIGQFMRAFERNDHLFDATGLKSAEFVNRYGNDVKQFGGGVG